MKFNKKSLVKVAILSAILGLNGMCFNDVVNGAEVLMLSPNGVIDPQRQPAEVGKDEDEKPECVVCLEEAGPDKVLFTLGCCKANVCAKCALDNNAKNPRCPLCKAGDKAEEERSLENKSLTEEKRNELKKDLKRRRDIYNGTIEFLKKAEQAKKDKVFDSANENPNNKNLEKNTSKNNSFEKKVNKQPIRLSDEFTIGLSNKEMKKLGGWQARFAAEQNKLASERTSELNEKAWNLFEQGKISEFEKLYDDDALSYRKIRQITMEDARDAILEKTGSNCSQNACYESGRSESPSYERTQFSTGDYASQGNSPVQVMVDGQPVWID